MFLTRGLFGFLFFGRLLKIFVEYAVKGLALLVFLYASGCLIYIWEYGYKDFSDKRFLIDPFGIIKFLWSYLKFWKDNRFNMPMLKSLQIVGFLILPYFAFKIGRFALGFLLFITASNCSGVLPNFSSFVLRSKFVGNFLHRDGPRAATPPKYQRQRGFSRYKGTIDLKSKSLKKMFEETKGLEEKNLRK